MKGFLRLLLYYFRWRSILTGVAVLGALLLGFGLSVSAVNLRAGYGFGMLGYLLGLAMPYFLAPVGLRCLLRNRALAQVPGLPLRAGQALLVLTVIVAVVPVLLRLLVNLHANAVSLAALIFIMASLYSFAMYLILPSRYMPWWFSLTPLVLIGTSARFKLHPSALLDYPMVLTATLLATAVAWALLLYQLAHTRKFEPLYSSTATSYTQHHTLQHAFGPLAGALRGHTVAVASLLFAYPASTVVRYVNVVGFVLLQPIIAVLATQLLGTGNKPSWVTQHPVQIYLLFSLFMGSIASLNQGELSARARLLWLRLAGTRTTLWQHLERELWVNLLILSATLLAISIVAVLLDPTIPYLGHYTLLVMACNAYFLYFQLCSRLYHWPSLLQGFVLLATSLVVIGATIIALRTPGFSVLSLLESGLVLSAAGFRLLARRRFLGVDWLQLRHVVSRQVLAEA